MKIAVRPFKMAIMDGISTIVLATVNDEVELAETFPWAGRLFRYGQQFGILGASVRMVSRDPVGWWEWICSWFGFSYEEAKLDIYLDVIRLFLVLISCVGGISLFVFVASLICATVRSGSNLILWSVASIARAASNVVVRVFRLLASSLEPGPGEKLVVPSKAVIPYHTESLRAGSILTKYDLPKFQVVLGTSQGDRFVAHGCGVRLDVQGVDNPFIITPLHVYQGLPSDFSIRGKTAAVAVNKDSMLLGGVPSTRAYYDIDTDVVAFSISQVEASQLGLSKTTIVSSLPGAGVLARIVGPSCTGSTGALSSDPTVFGQLVYCGSTVAGFSGAAYIVGSSVAGIHCAGGARNTGYSLRLAYVTLKHLLGIKPEATEDWLEDVIRKKKQRIDIDLTWQGLDTKRIRVRGEYHIVDSETFYAFVGDARVTASGTVEYDDAVGESSDAANLNGARQETTQASSSATQSGQDTISKLRLKIANQQKTLNELNSALSRKSGTKRNRNSDGQEGTHAPSSQPESI